MCLLRLPEHELDHVQSDWASGTDTWLQKSLPTLGTALMALVMNSEASGVTEAVTGHGCKV
jgi:hypothetical protein